MQFICEEVKATSSASTATFICAGCGIAFQSRQKSAKYCGQVCLRRGIALTLKAKNISPPLKGAPLDREARACAACGAPFVPYNPSASQRKRGHVQRFCSKSCGVSERKIYASQSERKAAERGRRRQRDVENKSAAPLATCAQCGQAYAPRSKVHLFCGPQCRAKAARRLSMVGGRNCKGCGAEFSPAVGERRRLFCSEDCCVSFHKADAGKNHRKRARHYGVQYEPVRRIDVFNRDGWICQICGVPTPKKLIGKVNPRAPELDHRISLASGGGHTWANVQCACRSCNAAKGSKTVKGQMNLFPNPSVIG